MSVQLKKNTALAVAVLAFYALLLLLASRAHGQGLPARQAQAAACTTAWLRAHLDVREATGRNDGPAVWAIIRANGGTAGEEWCGDTQAGAQRGCGLPVPDGSAGSYNWFRNLHRTVLKGEQGSLDLVRPGYCIGIYSQRRGRIAHITRAIEPGRAIRRGRPARGWYCIAGNEGSGTNAGVHYTFYPSSALFAAANWLW